MRKKTKTILLALMAILSVHAGNTLPIEGEWVKASDPNIQYMGRISFANPDSPAWTWPGAQILASFEGTSLKMVCKPGSGYFMASIDQATPFKVSLSSPSDSVVNLATALPYGIHRVQVMYIVEGYEYRPQFRGFVLDKGCHLVPSPPLPTRKIE